MDIKKGFTGTIVGVNPPRKPPTTLRNATYEVVPDKTLRLGTADGHVYFDEFEIELAENGIERALKCLNQNSK